MRMGTSDRNKNRKRAPSPSKMKDPLAALCQADVLLIVPPFHVLDCPSLAVHLLQACGREAGFRVQVLYANFLLASVIGEEAYSRICDTPVASFAGERFFARCAFGLPRLGRRASRMFEADWVIGPDKHWEIRPDFDCYNCQEPITLQELLRLERYAEGYVGAVARAVCQQRYKVVGCTTTFQQTAASVALLNQIKAQDKDTITILGGANCDGDMAQGIASLGSRIDYIFSGECEVTFPKFVHAVLAGLRPQRRILFGEPCRDMDALPTPTFMEFYEQRSRFLPASKVSAEQTEIPYETSRGCWWGEKHNCTFCGLNGERMAFRQKSPDRVISDLRALLDAHPTRRVVMTDNIMPYTYFRTLLPRLAGEFPGAAIFYETKANLLLPQVLALKRARITSIQPGIESLSSRLLTLMKKGVQARQNLMLLRYARAAGVYLDWILLWGFPGDDVTWYEETLAILPLLHHLQPPCAMAHLSIERFSPYYSSPTEFGVRNIKPLAGYYDILPTEADIERIAYHFTAEYRCGAHDHAEVIQKMWQEMARWQATWRQNGGLPSQDLELTRRRRSYVLVDTRDLWRKKRLYSLNRDGASTLATARPYSGSGFEAWAVREKLAVTVDGWFVPLAVADPRILLELTEEQDRARRALLQPDIPKVEPMLATQESQA
jgi:ribosomal peptide maturation radical SAM protein 1